MFVYFQYLCASCALHSSLIVSLLLAVMKLSLRPYLLFSVYLEYGGNCSFDNGACGYSPADNWNYSRYTQGGYGAYVHLFS